MFNIQTTLGRIREIIPGNNQGSKKRKDMSNQEIFNVKKKETNNSIKSQIQENLRMEKENEKDKDTIDMQGNALHSCLCLSF